MKRTLTALVLAVVLPALSWAQGADDSGLTVRSIPPGAELVLKGDAVVTGVTPTTIRYPLRGSYDLTVKKYGYEDYKTKVVLNPTQAMQLDVELSRKTGFKAALRSLVIPGWGQHYTGRNTKAFAFSFLVLGSVAAFLVADHNYDIKVGHYEQRLEEYDNAVAAGNETTSSLQRRLDDLTRAQQDAYDVETIRMVTGGAIVGIWGLNVLDALLFSPKEGGTFSVKGLSVSPTTTSGGVGITLSSAF